MKGERDGRERDEGREGWEGEGRRERGIGGRGTKGERDGRERDERREGWEGGIGRDEGREGRRERGTGGRKGDQKGE